MPSSAFVLNGQVGLLPPRQMLAYAGKYFTVTNPTPGTAIAYASQVTFSATANGLFGIQNRNVSGGPNIVLDYLKLVQTATAPTGTLVMRMEAFNETGLVTLTGNVATRTPVQTNQGFAQATTNAVVQSFAAGAATVPAAVGTRVLQTVVAIDTGVTVAQDQFIVQFGGTDIVPGSTGLTAARATAPATVAAQAGVVVVAPGTTSWLNMWWLTQATNVPSFEFELTYAEV